MTIVTLICLGITAGYLFRKYEETLDEDALDKALKREEKLLSDIEDLERYAMEYRYTFEEIDPTILQDKIQVIIYDAEGRIINDNLELDVGEV